ncbi:hypothetical protein EMIT079MI2_170046 [Bacillus sp. IT-79MI2]|nr:hypothetical protein BTH41_01820 [Bacillus mycoides]
MQSYLKHRESMITLLNSHTEIKNSLYTEKAKFDSRLRLSL